MPALPLPALLGIFALAAAATWFAGIRLADATDVLASRFGMGDALGGLVLLAVATNLPEIAITVSAVAGGNPDVAIGNILGGIAVQTLVLAILDAARRDAAPLSRRAASLALVIEALLVIGMLAVALLAAQLPRGVAVAGLPPGPVVLVMLWIAGLWLSDRAARSLPWAEAGNGQRRPRGHARHQKEQDGPSTLSAGVTFATGALVTLAAGVALERSGSAAAATLGIGGVVFGATILAAATALPEISTGLASIRLGDDRLAISDILGGNAFLPVLFLPAALIAGTDVLAGARPADLYAAALGILMSAVVAAGLIFRPQRRRLGIGTDSLVLVIVYGIGMAGFVAAAG